MTTVDFMTALFTQVDDHCNERQINGKHPQAHLYMSVSQSVCSLPSKAGAIDPSIAG